MIPSFIADTLKPEKVYQRGLVIDSQLVVVVPYAGVSVSKGIGD